MSALRLVLFESLAGRISILACDSLFHVLTARPIYRYMGSYECYILASGSSVHLDWASVPLAVEVADVLHPSNCLVRY